MAVVSSPCGPTLPPTNVPTPADPELEPFRAALQAYVDQTQPFRKEAAIVEDKAPGNATPTGSAEAALRARESAVADALKRLRPSAKQGDLFPGDTAAIIKRNVSAAFAGPKHDLLMDALGEQNDTGAATEGASPLAINERVNSPRVPPLLLDSLPPLPKQLEYNFLGRALVLHDVDANVAVDYLPDVLPEHPPVGVPTVASARASGAPPLPLPSLRGGTIFALIGDSGSGDLPQVLVSQAMLAYFSNARRFPFVLMLGDNLYHDDYIGEFSDPYKPLLERGVKFYAALGNHDRDLEIHFKPFNMNDRDYYSFDQGDARFAALNTNHPGDAAQAKWFDGVFRDAGDKWRIAFFHHPLYSSGPHAAESRDVIRPALEDVLIRNHVNVVFSGHEHLYERVRPQKGIRYFVSGGGGRNLYDYQPSEFDEVGLSEHHFMVAEIAGDRLFFEAVTPDQKLLDCGVIWRTGQPPAKLDNDTQAFVTSCNAAMGGRAH